MFSRAAMFNREAQQRKFRAAEIIETLALEKGAVVVDVGAGGGYFAVRFAKAVGPGGTVYAVDKDESSLAYAAKYACDNDVENVQILRSDQFSDLPLAGCDLIFARNVCHHLKEPEKYFGRLKPCLKTGGRLVIIDYKKRSLFSLITMMGHYVDEDALKEALGRAGYTVADSYDFLPVQSFTVFEAV